jgi:hypothetical protein
MFVGDWDDPRARPVRTYPLAFIRPLGDGVEWSTDPERVTLLSSEERDRVRPAYGPRAGCAGMTLSGSGAGRSTAGTAVRRFICDAWAWGRVWDGCACGCVACGGVRCGVRSGRGSGLAWCRKSDERPG